MKLTELWRHFLPWSISTVTFELFIEMPNIEWLLLISYPVKRAAAMLNQEDHPEKALMWNKKSFPRNSCSNHVLLLPSASSIASPCADNPLDSESSRGISKLNPKVILICATPIYWCWLINEVIWACTLLDKGITGLGWLWRLRRILWTHLFGSGRSSQIPSHLLRSCSGRSSPRGTSERIYSVFFLVSLSSALAATGLRTVLMWLFLTLIPLNAESDYKRHFKPFWRNSKNGAGSWKPRKLDNWNERIVCENICEWMLLISFFYFCPLRKILMWW